MPPFRTLLAAAALLAAMPAAAQTIAAADPESIAGVLRAEGYKAELTTGKNGSPVIESAAEGSKFLVFFYDCTEGRNCKTIQFFIGFTQPVVGLDRINEWNKAHRFGRAYIDREGDPVVEMDVDLDKGGMPRALFVANLDTWMSIVAKFGEFVTQE